MTSGAALGGELAAIVGEHAVLVGDAVAPYLADASASRGLRGHADAVVRPADARQVAAVVAWAYRHGMPLTARGGGTGFAGGAVPDGGVVVAMESLRTVRALDPGAWRMEVEAGLTTTHVKRLARENGLYFPPDPGAAEQSQIGGNVATNAGGPHAFKYGVTGSWVTGVEAVVAPGEVVTVGGPVRKDAAGYDLSSLLVGSEGTLGFITAVWLRLIPPPEAAYPLVAFYPDAGAGCRAIEAAMASGVVPSAIEYLDDVVGRLALPAFPLRQQHATAFVVIAEADGDVESARAGRAALREALHDGALSVHAPTARADVAEIWRWRDTVSGAVDSHRGGKVSEDICVPVDRLEAAIAATVEIGQRHGIEACSWGHAGDGNLHSTFLVAPGDEDAQLAARAAMHDLFGMAIELGGSVSGEHGLGRTKSGQLSRQWAPDAVRMHEGIKRLFDPKSLLNPGVKLP
jgi:FAD/FMN-containing dehydrogenase